MKISTDHDLSTDVKITTPVKFDCRSCDFCMHDRTMTDANKVWITHICFEAGLSNLTQIFLMVTLERQTIEKSLPSVDIIIFTF